MAKVKVLSPFVDGNISYAVGDKITLDDVKAFALAKAEIVEFVNTAEYKKILTAEIKIIQKQEDEAKELAAIVHKDELESERTKLQLRVDEITDALNDGSDYYKSYIDLVPVDTKQKDKKEDK